MSLVDRYRTWFDYELDAHAKTLVAIDSVPQSGRDAAFQTALDLFAHMMAARGLWLHRLGGAGAGPSTVAELFPAGVARQRLDDLLAAMRGGWERYLAALDHAELGRTCEYRAIDGARFANSVEEILTQLFGHAWHHRGQIMALVRRCGGEPQAADFVFWCRRPRDADA